MSEDVKEILEYAEGHGVSFQDIGDGYVTARKQDVETTIDLLSDAKSIKEHIDWLISRGDGALLPEEQRYVYERKKSYEDEGYIPTRDPSDDFMEIVEEGETMNDCYGIEAFKLRRSDIDALLQGKYLWHDVQGYEYAIYLYYDDEEEKTDGKPSTQQSNSQV
jgi:hypothetical protein